VREYAHHQSCLLGHGSRQITLTRGRGGITAEHPRIPPYLPSTQNVETVNKFLRVMFLVASELMRTTDILRCGWLASQPTATVRNAEVNAFDTTHMQTYAEWSTQKDPQPVPDASLGSLFCTLNGTCKPAARLGGQTWEREIWHA
jgi:hypothetical protein